MNYWEKRSRAFRCAWTGLNRMFRNEAHAKIHLLAAVFVIAGGFICGLSQIEWSVILLCIGGVFMGEAFNTAIEKLSDRVTREYDELIKSAKDVAAGAVLLFVIAVVVVGLIIFVPHILAMCR